MNNIQMSTRDHNRFMNMLPSIRITIGSRAVLHQQELSHVLRDILICANHTMVSALVHSLSLFAWASDSDCSREALIRPDICVHLELHDFGFSYGVYGMVWSSDL